MAKLYFYYAAMNAGKSTVLLQSAYNYQERGMEVLLLTSAIDDRFKVGHITSRIGVESKAELYRADTNIWELVLEKNRPFSCILVDEAQFLSEQLVFELAKIVDLLKIPVLAYGLRTDFRGELFSGSKALLALAEELIEIKTICRCGRKATMNIRLDENGKMTIGGALIEIGGNDRYEAVCRRCYMGKKEQIHKQEEYASA